MGFGFWAGLESVAGFGFRAHGLWTREQGSEGCGVRDPAREIDSHRPQSSGVKASPAHYDEIKVYHLDQQSKIIENYSV